MEALMVYGGNNIFDMTLKKVFEHNPDQFKGAGSSGEFNYAYQITKPPTALLGNFRSTPPRNIKIRLSVVTIKITHQDSGATFNRTVAITAAGLLSIVSRILSIRSLTVSIDNPEPVDALIQAVINSKIIPSISAQISAIRLPQLQNIFGTDVPVQLRSGTVISGPALEIGANISGLSRSAADRPASGELPSLNNGTSSNATIIGTASAQAINLLIKKLVGSISHRFNKTANGAFGFAAGVKGRLSAPSPIIIINNGRGKVKLKISTTLHAGVKAPLIGWKWIPIAVPDIEVTVSHTLPVRSNKAVIKLTRVDSIRIDLNWPPLFTPVESLIENLLNSVVSHFKGMINDNVRGKEIAPFNLPNSIPGTAFNAGLNFRELSYYKKSLKSTIKVTA
ncbi:hypothetical protein DC498_24935 [Terrimonas sp.]|uniref:hypothetical protein n=1 Tax=Terrimonas sp. TaxID=1914338 RepID=UPI000D513F9B|nr:hypothetical protein [Terrimonas sp.]PVD49466.1 hypothetical protein DC498_24935 [Terrimonas sp.]